MQTTATALNTGEENEKTCTKNPDAFCGEKEGSLGQTQKWPLYFLAQEPSASAAIENSSGNFSTVGNI